jgi:hypothetical protein
MAYPFIPTVAANGMFAPTIIAPTFNHIFTAGVLPTFCTGVFFPFIAPIERPITY